jgi:hypothetical protein
MRYLTGSWGFGAIMTSADEYRRYAAECVRASQSATNQNSRALFLEMAQKWAELADETEARLREESTPGSIAEQPC